MTTHRIHFIIHHKQNLKHIYQIMSKKNTHKSNSIIDNSENANQLRKLPHFKPKTTNST